MEDIVDMSGAVKYVIKVYKAAILVSGVSAASLAERVSESKAGSKDMTFGGDEPPALQMTRSLVRWAEAWQRDIEGPTPGLPAQDKTSAARKAQTRAVLGEVGRDPTAVAFTYGLTTEGVRKLRGNNSRDPDTGQRVSEMQGERVDGNATTQAPLTAPATTGLQLLERATNREAGA